MSDRLERIVADSPVIRKIEGALWTEQPSVNLGPGGSWFAVRADDLMFLLNSVVLRDKLLGLIEEEVDFQPYPTAGETYAHAYAEQLDAVREILRKARTPPGPDVV